MQFVRLVGPTGTAVFSGSFFFWWCADLENEQQKQHREQCNCVIILLSSVYSEWTPSNCIFEGGLHYVVKVKLGSFWLGCRLWVGPEEQELRGRSFSTQYGQRSSHHHNYNA